MKNRSKTHGRQTGFLRKFIEFEKRHKAATLFSVAMILAAWLYASGAMESFAHGLGQYEYAGAFFAGMLFAEGATTPFGIAAFFTLGQDLNPFAMAAIGATGALVTDFALYRLFSSGAGKKIRISKSVQFKVPEIKSKALKAVSPLIAGALIASPLPDEFAMAFLGMEHYEMKKFLLLVFVFKFFAILAIGIAAGGLI